MKIKNCKVGQVVEVKQVIGYDKKKNYFSVGDIGVVHQTISLITRNISYKEQVSVTQI